MGDYWWQASKNVEEPILFRDLDRLLEFDGCYLFARRLDAVGYSQLREGPAATSDGYRSRRSSGEVSRDYRGHSVQREQLTVLTREHASAIFDKLRKYSSADEVELLVSGGRSSLTRFANNAIHQNVAEESHGLSLRVSVEVGAAKGGRTARASTNKLDDDSLRRLVQTAETLLRLQQPDPELLAMPTPREVVEGE